MPKEPRQRQRPTYEQKDTFTRNLVLGMVGLVVLSGVIFTVLDRRDGGSDLPLAIEQLSSASNGDPLTPDVLEENDYGIVFNKDSAPRIDIWEDFQCPYCGQFEAAIGDYIEGLARTNDAKVVYHMASFLGQESVRAANAAYCSIPEGRFLDYHKALYTIQGAENSGLFSNKNLIEVGKRLDITSSEFESCVNGNENGEMVKKVAESMEKNQVNSTPTVFINGQLWKPSSNTFDLEEFKAAVEAAR